MSEKFQFFDGRKFTRDDQTGYYLCSTENETKARKRMHVYVWEYFYGSVPEGYHIHHIDGDKSNNAIQNLQLLSAKEHEKLHGKMWTDERMEKARKNMEKASVKAKEWHSSEDGHKWHKEHYEKTKEKLYQIRQFKCLMCGKEFQSTQAMAKFCCNNCKSAYRRKIGIDDVTKICSCCGGEYTANKYQKTKYCQACKDKKHKKNRQG